MRKFIALVLAIAMVSAMVVTVGAVNTPQDAFTLSPSVETATIGTAYTLSIITNNAIAPGGVGIEFTVSGCTITAKKGSWNGGDDVDLFKAWDADKLIASTMFSEGTIPAGTVIFHVEVTPTAANSSVSAHIPVKTSTMGEGVYVTNETYTIEMTATEAHTHDWGEWLPSPDDETTHTRSCSGCSDVETEPHVMVFDSHITAATCLVDGTDKYVCSVCGKEETRAVTGGTHNYIIVQQNDENTHKLICEYCSTDFITEAHDYYPEEIVTAATCEHTGLATKKCIVCEYVSERIIDKLEHEYDEGVITQQPTCTEPGVKKFTCKHCDDYYTEPVDALGHDWETDFTVDTPATCTSVGSKSRHCSRCTEKTDVTEIEKVAHEYDNGVITQQPTCTEPGVKKFTCLHCDDYYTEPVDALGHNWELQSHKDATCTEDGFDKYECSRCHIEDNRPIEAPGHSLGEWVETTHPTCTEAGVKTKKCANCDYEETQPVDALGHDWETEFTVDTPATCSSVGYKSHHCSRCTEKKDVTEIEKTSHEYDNGVITQQPTCTEQGVKKFTCLHCDDYYTEPVDALGHDFVEEPTYLDAQYHTLKCSRCTETTTKEHTAGEWTVTVDPTYTTAGHKELRCTVCNGLLDEADIDPLTCPHEHTEVINAFDPTCTEPGYSGDTYCNDCKKVIAEGHSVDAPGHNYEWKSDYSETQHAKVCSGCSDVKDIADHVYPDVWEIVTEPTADAKGSARKVCECGKEITAELTLKDYKPATYTEDGYSGDVVIVDGENVTVVREGSVVSKIDHEHQYEIVGAKEATTEEDGYTGDKVCALCGDVLETGRVIPKIVTGDDNPQTGDASAVIYAVLMIVSLGALALLASKRKVY